MYEYPFGNGQQLNLDWFLAEWKNLLAAWEAEKNGVEGALQAEIDRAEAALADVFAARDAAAQSAANALESKNAAAQSASDASGYLATVRADANTASNAAQNAAQSESNAAESAQTALASKNAAGQSERNAAQSEQNALQSKNAAAQSAADALANKDAAAQSAEDAEDAASSVEASAQQIATNTNDISDLKTAIDTYLSLNTWQGIVRVLRSGGTVPNGTEFVVPHSVYGDVHFITRRQNVDKVADDPTAQTVTIQAKYLLSSNGETYAAKFQYDRPEAMFAPLEEAIPNGTVVKFTSVAYGQWVAGTWHFTATADIPVGAMLCLNKYQDTVLESTSVVAYADQKSTTALATMPLAQGDGDATVNLGTWQNHPQRISYGSNNEAQSSLVQFLNADTGNNAMNTVWTPKTPYDMMNIAFTSLKGFLGGFPEDFRNTLRLCDVHNITNNVFETGGYNTNDEYTYRAKIWLPSRKEIYGSNETAKEASEEQFPYYAEIGTTDADKLMYAEKAASPTTYWLRTPYASDASNVRVCYAMYSGALSSTNAGYSIALAPLGILA